jgi:hypothetical protein
MIEWFSDLDVIVSGQSLLVHRVALSTAKRQLLISTIERLSEEYLKIAGLFHAYKSDPWHPR